MQSTLWVRLIKESHCSTTIRDNSSKLIRALRRRPILSLVSQCPVIQRDSFKRVPERWKLGSITRTHFRTGCSVRKTCICLIAFESIKFCGQSRHDSYSTQLAPERSRISATQREIRSTSPQITNMQANLGMALAIQFGSPNQAGSIPVSNNSATLTTSNRHSSET